MDNRIKYSTMIVRDMEESIRFYADILGFEQDSQYKPLPGTTITLMKSKGETMVELIESKDFKVGYYSIGMEVDDLAGTIAEIEKRGGKITKGPARTLVGSCAFLEDPNGVTICLIHHHD